MLVAMSCTRTQTSGAIFCDVVAFGTHAGHAHHGSRVVHTLSLLPTGLLDTVISVPLTELTVIACSIGPQ